MGRTGVFKAVENGTAYGPWPVVEGDRLRVEVAGGLVYYKRNGVTRYLSTKKPTYPLLVDTSIYRSGTTIRGVVLSGALENAVYPCDTLLTGDFDGDSRTDLLCYKKDTRTSTVALASLTGFAAPATWLSGVTLEQPVVADFNGDGKADVALHDGSTGNYGVVLSTGTAFVPPVLWGSAKAVGTDGLSHTCRLDPTTVGVGDFNGDGLPDVWCERVTDFNMFVGLSNGSSFTFSIFGQIGCSDSGSGRIGTMDFDGDGKDDFYCIGATAYTPTRLYVATSNGSKFVGGFGGLDDSFCGGNNFLFGDFNGDGRADVACTLGKVALSTGKYLAEQGNYGSWCQVPTKNYFAADLDGDGATEIVCNNSDAGPTDIQVRKWTGSGLGPAETWKTNWCTGLMRAGDFNGDGKTDLHCETLSTPVAIGGTGQTRADLLTEVRNGIGGTTYVAYTPSSVFQNTNGPGPKYVVKTLTVDDGQGGPPPARTATRAG